MFGSKGKGDIEFALRLRADLEQGQRELERLAAALDDTGETAAQAGRRIGDLSTNTEDMRQELNALPGMLRNLAVAIGVAFSTREIAQAAEAYTTISNRLAVVTSSAEELADAQDAVFRVAQEGRQPLTETAELYQRIATNADQLNLSAAGVEGVVDTINKTLAISGTTGQAASAALVQLGQAFASGTLRGEELNSVLEQAPALARTLSDGLGVSIGEIRELGLEGKLTAQNVVQALLSQSDAVDQQFSKIETTGSQAMTVLGNSLTRVVGELNTATGASVGFGNALIGVANWLDSGELTDGALNILTIWGGAFEAISADVASLEQEFDALSAGGDSTAQLLVTAFKELPVNLRSAIQLATTEILALFDRAVAYAVFTGEAIKSAFNDTGRQAADQALQARLEQINSVRAESIDSIFAERDAILDNAAAERQRRDEERASREAARQQRLKDIAALREQAKASGNVFGAGIKTGGSEADAKRAKEAEKYVAQLVRTASIIGMTAAEVRQYELAEKGLTGAMQARAEAALALIDASEKNRQAAVNARTNAELEVEFLRAAGLETEAGLLEIRTRFEGMRTDFEKVGNEAGLAWLDKLIPVAEAKVRVDDMQRQMERILGEQQRQEQSVNVQQDAGLLSEVAAREQILDIHKKTHDQLLEMRPLLEEMARMPGEVGQAASNALSQLDNQAARLDATTTLLAETLSQGLESGLSNALAGLVNGTTDLEGAIRSLAQTVVQSLAQIAANQLAQSAISGLVGLFGAAAGGGATAGGFISSVQASRRAGGGQVRGPGTQTSDSIPTLLSDQEYVLRAAVVTQPGMLPLLNDINARGMAALNDLRPVRHNTGGLAGVPAPALPAPTMSGSKLADPAKSGATLKNDVNLYLMQNPDEIASMAWGKSGKSHFYVELQQNAATVRQLLGID